MYAALGISLSERLACLYCYELYMRATSTSGANIRI